MVSSSNRCAILGGTFNPPHAGHLQLAQQAQQQAQIDRVFWVPSDRAPHKADHDLPSITHRAAMVNLAIAPYPSFQQVQPPSPSPFSYGIDTFTYLTQHAPAQHWFWIVGLDTFQTLPRWYRISEFAARCQWIVAPRVLPCRQPSDSLPASLNDTEAIAATVAQTMHEQGLRLQWTVLNMPLLPVSSTQLRQQISIPPLSPDGSSFIATWLSSPVIQYINQHQLYRYRRST